MANDQALKMILSNGSKSFPFFWEKNEMTVSKPTTATVANAKTDGIKSYYKNKIEVTPTSRSSVLCCFVSIRNSKQQ